MPSLPTQADLNLPATNMYGQIDGSAPAKSAAKIPQTDEKIKYMVNRQDQVDIHCNLFDGSFVEYALDDSNGCFEVVFDQKLYDAPEAVLNFEKQMMAE